MSPRPYNLGKRAASVEQTKQRIRHAALCEYAETGVAAASMQSIARRADVAPGTVLYHYPDPDDLVRDVMSERVQAMDVPTVDTLDTDAPLAERITWLTHELFRVYEGSELDYHAWMRSREHPEFRRYEQWYYQVYGAVLAAALGPDHTDARAFQVVSALIDPGFRASLTERGLTHDDAVEETVRLVLGWLAEPPPTAPGPD